MKKEALIAVFIALSMATTTLSAVKYELKENMKELNSELIDVHKAIIASKDAELGIAIRKFAKHADELLSNKYKFAALLAEGKKERASIAVETASIVAVNVKIIEDALANKDNLPETRRKEDAQRGYTYIIQACFNCHNLVRDMK